MINVNDFVKVNFDNLDNNRGMNSTLKQMYGETKRKVVGIFTSYDGTLCYELEGISGGFSVDEIMI